MEKPQFMLLGGPNGSGKSTIYKVLQELDQSEWVIDQIHIPKGNYINPDTVARNEEIDEFQAGRKSLQMFNDYAKHGKSFSYETTLSGRGPIHRVMELKEKGYRIISVFMWLRSVELSMIRVTQRASKGKHYIPMNDILRRHVKTIRTFLDEIINLSDVWVALDNSTISPKFIAWGGTDFYDEKNLLFANNEALVSDFLRFYKTGEDPCFPNFKNLKHPNPKEFSFAIGDKLTTNSLKGIEEGIAKDLRSRPKGMFVAQLDHENNVIFEDV
jgi:predicted ABC-type ATPase